MKIDQVVSNFGSDQRITEDALYIQKFLRSMGFSSEIYTDFNNTKEDVHFILGAMHRDPYRDIMIHHFSTGSTIPWAVINSGAYHICRLHSLPSLKMNSHQTHTKIQEQLNIVLASAQEIWAPYVKCQNFQVSSPGDNYFYLPYLHDSSRVCLTRKQYERADFLLQNPNHFICHIGQDHTDESLFEVCLAFGLIKKTQNNHMKLLTYGDHKDFFCEKVKPLLKKIGLKGKSFHEDNMTNADVIYVDSKSIPIDMVIFCSQFILSFHKESFYSIDPQYISSFSKPTYIDVYNEKLSPVDLALRILSCQVHMRSHVKPYNLIDTYNSFKSRMLATLDRIPSYRDYEKKRVLSYQTMNPIKTMFSSKAP